MQQKKQIKSSIFGILDTIDTTQKKKLKLKKLVPSKINNDLKYNTGKSTSNVDFSKLHNQVEIPLELLKNIQDKAQSRGQTLADIMLRSSIPSILGLSSAVEYTTSVLVDGFSVRQENISTNQELANLLNSICSLEIVFQFLKNSKLPKATKKHYLKIVTERVAEGGASMILQGEKRKAISDIVKNGIVSQRKALEGNQVKDTSAGVMKRGRRAN
jgi:hypothetical protein